MSVKRITPGQRFSRSNPCPRCGGHKDLPQGRGERCYGWIDDDGKFVHCTREEYADGAKYEAESETFLHVRNPDGMTYRPWTPQPPTQLRPLPPRIRGAAPQTDPPEAKTHARKEGTMFFYYGPNQRIERVDKRDEHGNWKKECFSQHRANGTWSSGDGPGRTERIYRRDRLTERPSAPVYLLEGEPKTDRAQDLIGEHAVAISWRGGCGQLQKSLSAIVEIARGRDVILMADSDRKGRDAMQTIAAAIHGIAHSVRILDLYGDESGRDIEDWIEEGHTADELRALIANLVEYVPPAMDSEPPVRRFRAYTATEMKARQPVSFLVEDLIPAGGFGTMIGKPGALKTFAGIDIGLSVATGATWHGRETKQGSVLYISAEGAAGFGQRISAWEKARSREAPDTFRVITDAPQLLRPDEVEEIIATALDDPPVIVILDTVARTMGGDENSTKDMSDYVNAVGRIQRETGAAVLGIHHMGWNAERGRGSSALFAGVDVEITITRDDRDGPMTLAVTKAKEFAEPMPLTLVPRVIDLDGRASSLVLEREAMGFTELTGTMKKIGLILLDTFGVEGATTSKWEEVCVNGEGIARPAFYRARKDLVEGGFVQSSGEKRGALFTVTDEFRIKVSEGLRKVSDTDVRKVSRYQSYLRTDTLIPTPDSEDEEEVEI
jgi:5S rRNA maturation endonuclease (ribonuclease M5)